MFRRLKSYLLRRLYSLLVIKLQPVDKSVLKNYEKFRSFCTIRLFSTKGEFQFVFKEDRRKTVRNKKSVFRLTSYFVELLSPEEFNLPTNALYNKVIMVVTIRLGPVNYEAMGRLLLDLYIDSFSKKT